MAGYFLCPPCPLVSSVHKFHHHFPVFLSQGTNIASPGKPQFCISYSNGLCGPSSNKLPQFQAGTLSAPTYYAADTLALSESSVLLHTFTACPHSLKYIPPFLLSPRPRSVHRVVRWYPLPTLRRHSVYLLISTRGGHICALLLRPDLDLTLLCMPPRAGCGRSVLIYSFFPLSPQSSLSYHSFSN